LKRLVNQIFLIPILFLLAAILMYGIFYFYFIEDVSKKEFKKIEDLIVNNEKKVVKANLDGIFAGAREIRVVAYDATKEVLKSVLDQVIRNYVYFDKGEEAFFKNHFNDKLFFYIISRKIVYPKIYQTFMKVDNKNFLISVFNGKKYLSVEKKIGDKIIGVAYKLDLIDSLVKNEIINYIKFLNLDKDYIAIGEITNWYATKGVFGKIVYHPIKYYEGKILSLDSPDVKGNFYKKKYFNCLKEHDSCYVEYYFLNPQTNKIEKKLSYFMIYRPYNFVFVKGIYYSTLIKQVNKVKEETIKDFYKFFIITFLLLLFFVILSFVVSYFLSKKLASKVLEEYNILKNELFERIYFDEVTKLPNKFKLLEDLKNYKSLVILDIEDFANINNLYGFDFGDKILIEVSKFLRKRFKRVYKVGSDEFAIPFNTKLNEKMLKKISSLEFEFEKVELSFIVGGSEVPDLYITAESSLKLAQKRGLKYLLYDEKYKTIQKEKFEKILMLRKVLKENSIIPYYQAIVDKFGNVKKYEALMRVKYKNDVYSPFIFMDLIKEAKLYDDFSKLMIKKVFEDLVSNKIKNVSVNLSFLDISNKEIRKFILEYLKKYKIGERITFEILESESLQNMEIVKHFVKELKNYGSKIAIDDFGSGYSNLVNILSLKPDYIKIDGSLIKHVQNPEYFEIVRLINDFAKKFNIHTVAEFVENKEIFEILKKIGIEYFQGYYFHKPEPFDKIS